MFDYESRKKQLNYFLSKTINILDKMSMDNNSIGFILYCIHYSTVIVTIIYLLIYKKGKLYYFLLGLTAFGLFINLYFNCCPVLKIERKLFNDDEWGGIYEILRIINIEPTTKNIKKSFLLLIILVTIILGYKHFIH